MWPSAKTVYALRACTVLARAYPDTRLKAAEIANASHVPLRFLAKILGELRDAGLVSAKRGYRGGYAFTRDPRYISVGELTVAMRGYELFAPLAPERLQPRIAFVEALRAELSLVASNALESTTIEDLVRAPAAERDQGQAAPL